MYVVSSSSGVSTIESANPTAITGVVLIESPKVVAASRATPSCDQMMPGWTRSLKKLRSLMLWRACSTSIELRCFRFECCPAPSRRAKSTNSASGVASGKRWLFLMLCPLHVTIKRSWAARVASSKDRRTSSRASWSPMRRWRSMRSSPSPSLDDKDSSSNPTTQTTRKGTPRNGIIEVAVIAPVRNGWRPGTWPTMSLSWLAKSPNGTDTVLLPADARKTPICFSGIASSSQFSPLSPSSADSIASHHSPTERCLLVRSESVKTTSKTRMRAEISSMSDRSTSSNASTPSASNVWVPSGTSAPSSICSSELRHVCALKSGASRPLRLRCSIVRPQRTFALLV